MRSTFRDISNLFLYIAESDKGLIPEPILERSLDLVEGKSYLCLIGVEKLGLIWASKVAKYLRSQFIYYSLELYTDDFQHLIMRNSAAFKRLRLVERECHKRAAATIIQDVDRARVLFRDNGISMAQATIFYVPVSLLGGPFELRTQFFHQTHNIPHDKKIILYFGQLAEDRFCLDLAHAAQKFPEQWVLIMHGWGNDRTINKIKAIDSQHRVRLSLDMIPSDRLQEAVASADVGLALYNGRISNDRLTAFSSEKMAFYAQCGVPFVAFDYPEYRALADREGSGVVIRDVKELAGAVATILTSHDEFRRNAHRSFEKYYNFRSNFAEVLNGLVTLRANRPVGVTLPAYG
jgi:glycosyltransferase involved in cell wall biosynthesis